MLANFLNTPRGLFFGLLTASTVLVACPEETPADTDTSAPPKVSCTKNSDCIGVLGELEACTVAACDLDTELCVVDSAPERAVCDDGDACTAESWCEAGSCVAGPTMVSCDDNNDCTADGCDPATGCTYVGVTNICDDLDPCTNGDVCGISGECAGTSTGQCSCNTDADCAQFDDEDACNGTLECSGGECQLKAGSVVQCASDDTCLPSTCDPATGKCEAQEAPNGTACSDDDTCTDGDVCTDGACIGGASVCTCVEDADCALYEDGDLCNGRFTCQQGGCKLDPSTVVTCSDGGGGCVKNACNPASGQCEFDIQPDGTTCGEGDPCTINGSCVQGECVAGAVPDCDDNNECTTDFCSPGFGCENQSKEGQACDDGDACTGNDQCQDKVCVGTTNECGICGDNICAVTETCELCPQDCGICGATCGDGSCQPGETQANCPQDCGGGGGFCGDGTCNAPAETQANCPADCSGGPVCGDGNCTAPQEDLITCPADCGGGTGTCGDAVCDFLEQLFCPEDCPACDGVCDPTTDPLFCPEDCIVCDNGLCELGETGESCPQDCPASCGDGQCDSSESNSICPTDCDPGANPCNGVCEPADAVLCPEDCEIVCGDGICSAPDETDENCAEDCLCGNGHCEEGEELTCPQDCPVEPGPETVEPIPDTGDDIVEVMADAAAGDDTDAGAETVDDDASVSDDGGDMGPDAPESD